MSLALIKSYVPKRWKRECQLLAANCLQSLRYYLTGGRLFQSQNLRAKSILFVCKGNVCRSVFAEERMRLLTKRHAVKLDSCGLDVDQGTHPPNDSVTAAAMFSCSLEGHKAKGLQEINMEEPDLILAMEYGQYRRLVEAFPQKKSAIRLLRSFSPFPSSLLCNIPDPYGSGFAEFIRTFKIIDKALQRLVRYSLV